jgi:Superinfection immunity protein
MKLLALAFATTVAAVASAFVSAPLYVLPTILAARRNLPGKQTVLALNRWFGWTGVMWLILLVYVCRSSRHQPSLG